MTKNDASTAAKLLRQFLAQLLTLSPDPTTDTAAELRRLVGDLTSYAETKIADGVFGPALAACFAAATEAGATMATMSRIHRLAATMVPVGNPQIAVVVAARRFAAIEQARISGRTTYRSRQDIDAAQALLNAEFANLTEYAADAGAITVYRTMMELHAAATRDLAERSRPLPRMVQYRFATSMPSLALANRLYGDAGRADELRDENKVPHPLFMAREGRALSA